MASALRPLLQGSLLLLLTADFAGGYKAISPSSLTAYSAPVASGAEAPLTDLESEVGRTAKVAAFLAQDAAVLSQELRGLQNALHGQDDPSARLASEQVPLGPALLQRQAPVLGGFAELSRSLPLALAASISVATAAPSTASPTAASSNSNAAAGTSTSNEDGDCGGAGQPTCGAFMKIFTFGYKFSATVSVLHWLIMLVAACLVFTCCLCCFRIRTRPGG